MSQLSTTAQQNTSRLGDIWMLIPKSVKIQHYKSIDSLEIPLQEINSKTCVIFVGLNEAGKSNILDAITSRYDKTKDLTSDCVNRKHKNNYHIKVEFTCDVDHKKFNEKLKLAFPEAPKKNFGHYKNKSRVGRI